MSENFTEAQSEIFNIYNITQLHSKIGVVSQETHDIVEENYLIMAEEMFDRQNADLEDPDATSEDEENYNEDKKRIRGKSKKSKSTNQNIQNISASKF